MIERVPAEVYCRYLLVHPDGHNNQAVKQLMEELRLYCPLDSQLERLRSKYRPPRPFYPLNRRHEPSIQFLRDAGIYSLFFQDLATKQAFAILQRPTIRSPIEQMLAQHAPYDQIVEGLDRHYRFACSINGLVKYEYLFFSSECPHNEHLQAEYIKHHQFAESKDKDVTATHIEAERYARYKNGNITAHELPTCAAAQNFIAIQNGFVPNYRQYDPKEQVARCRIQALTNMELELVERRPNSARNAMQLGQLVNYLTETDNHLKVPADATYLELQQDIKMAADQTPPKTLKQLTEAARSPAPSTFTTDVLPIHTTMGSDVELEQEPEHAVVSEVESEDEEREY